MLNLFRGSEWVHLSLDGLCALQDKIPGPLIKKSHLDMIWRVEVSSIRRKPLVEPDVLRFARRFNLLDSKLSY